jgi:hypothetical protein
MSVYKELLLYKANSNETLSWIVLGTGAEVFKNSPLGVEDGNPLATSRKIFTAKNSFGCPGTPAPP